MEAVWWEPGTRAHKQTKDDDHDEYNKPSQRTLPPWTRLDDSTRSSSSSMRKRPTQWPASLLSVVVVLTTTTLTTTWTASFAQAQQCNAPSAVCSQPPPAPLECGVYMAPSTLGEDTNMGMFLGQAVAKDAVISFPELVVPLLFREWGEHVAGIDDGVLWDRYIWEGDVVGLESYDALNREDCRAAFVPGVGCTVNSVLDMHNVDSTHGSRYDTAGLTRTQDPGTGAFSPYHASETTAVRDLPVGAELFASYGDYWIPQIPGAQITFEDLLDQADHFLQTDYLPFVEERHTNMSESLAEALWKFTTDEFPIYNPAMTNLPRASFADVWQAHQAQKQRDSNDDDDDEENSLVRHFIRQQSIRSLDYLEANGYCQDHLVPKTSTLPQAGRGAFANRFLPAGTVVGYAPLVHMGLHGHSILDIAYQDNDDNQEKRHQYDLILNYSFGHANSTVVLTPYGGMVNYINHHHTQPNVRLRWPTRTLVAHKPDWLFKTPAELSYTLEKIGLSFEYEALRDIQEGEEVLMDYGRDWDQAWQRHVQQWKPAGALDHVHATAWTEPYFRTMLELKQDPYPSNLVLLCNQTFTTSPTMGGYVWIPSLRPSAERSYCHVLERFVVDNDKTDDHETVLYMYTVELELADESTVTVRNYPAHDIGLYDLPFTADWHLPNVFRHPMSIPDDLLPASWQNGPPHPPPGLHFS